MDDSVSEGKLTKRERQKLEKELRLLRYRQYAGKLLSEDWDRIKELERQLKEG